jgi:hypothetical protein
LRGRIDAQPAACARLYARTRGLRAGQLPFTAPDFALALIWPERLTAEPLHAWVRERLRELVAATHAPADGE